MTSVWIITILLLVWTAVWLSHSPERHNAEGDYWQVFKFQCYLGRLHDYRKAHGHDAPWTERKRIYDEVFGCERF